MPAREDDLCDQCESVGGVGARGLAPQRTTDHEPGGAVPGGDGHLFGDAAVRENLLLMGLLGGGDPRPAGHATAGRVYVIVNGKVDTPPDAVPYALEPIAGDALNAILAGRMDTTLVLAYAGARLHGYGFSMAALPDDVPISGKPLAFDRAEMRRVFAAGERLGRSDHPWRHQPPASDQLGPWVIKLFDRLDRMSR